MSTNNYKIPDGGIYCGELNAQKLPEGKGTCEWPDGSKYDGYWVDGKKHGTGLMISAHETIKGFWYEDDLIRVFSKESSQEQDSKPSIPESYVGEKNSENKPHGKGKYTYSDGSTYDGYWVNGVKHGSGTQCDANGNVVRGFWWKGELIHIFGNEEQPKPEEKLPKNKTKMAAVLVGCDYVGTNQKTLQCCPKEVDEIGRNLKRIGVDVSILKNKTIKSIETALKDVCQKRHMYDHVLFYFSGHGAIYGGYHCLLDNEENLMSLESNVLGAFDDYDFKNIIIVHDACSSVISLNQETIDKLHDRGNMLTDNIRHTRNVLYAFSSLNGHPAWPAINHQYGMFALGFIENIHKKNLPVIQFFQNIADFVVSYSKQTHDCVIEVPHITKTFFDDTLCLYNPEE